VKAVGWVWRWRWLLVMNAFLISPVFLYEFRIGEGGPDKTILFLLAGSVLWLLFAQLIGRRIWIAHALMFPLYLAVATDIYVITHYHTRLSSSMLLTVFENLEDASEYLQTHYKAMATVLSTMLAGYALCMVKIRRLRVTTPRFAPLLPLGALLAVYLGIHHLIGGWWILVLTGDRNSPFGIFPQSVATVMLYREALQDARRAQGFSFGASRAAVPSEPETYVLVIGESSRAMSWQLYGHSRKTNPRLTRMSDLIVFRDVITQAAVTRVSVPLILTRGTIEDQERTARERSIVTAFHEAGFRTSWISTQQRDPTTGAINRYPREADASRFFDRRPDTVVVDTLKEMLGEATTDKQFFVIHTLGSHFNYPSRYPREFDIFPDDDARLNDKERTVNAYDNTIVYTDHVLAELIDVLRARPGIKALLYISDHGENLRDDERNLFGHYLNNEYDLPVPMLFWYSGEFAQRFPGKVIAAQGSALQPLNTRVVFHSLLDMAGITVHDETTARLSVFSPQLKSYARMVQGEPRPFDFDRWKLQHVKTSRAPLKASNEGSRGTIGAGSP
jgi:heptose-I-phosphate ethanolaminephosphotransferase